MVGSVGGFGISVEDDVSVGNGEAGCEDDVSVGVGAINGLVEGLVAGFLEGRRFDFDCTVGLLRLE